MKQIFHFRSVIALAFAFGAAFQGSSFASSFDPVLCQAVLNRSEIKAGNELGLTLTMFNKGDSPATDEIKAVIEFSKLADTKAGNAKEGDARPFAITRDFTPSKADEDKGLDWQRIAAGEPWPPTTMWNHNEPVTFGIPIETPQTLETGLYEFRVVLRKKDGEAVIPVRPGDGNAPQDVTVVGKIVVTPPERINQANVPETARFSEIPSLPPEPPSEFSGQTIALSNATTQVLLDSSVPLIQQIGSQKEGTLSSPRYKGTPEFRFYRKADGTWWSSLASPDVSVSYHVAEGPTRVIYTVEVHCGQETAFQCDITFSLAGNELRVGYENVQEQPGYLLTSVNWPRLLEVRGNDARMVTGRSAGRLLDPNRCTPATVSHGNFWGDPFTGGLLYTPDVLAAVTVISPGDVYHIIGWK